MLTLILPSEAPKVPWRDEFHAFPFGAPVGVLVGAVLAASALWIPYHIVTAGVWVASWGWFVLIPFFALMMGVPLLVAWLCWEEVRAAVRRSNWCARLAPDALYVNLRSWRNWRLGDAERTVVRIPLASIESVQEVREEWRVLPRAGVRRVFKAYVVVNLRNPAPLTEIREASREEIRRVLTDSGFLRGVSTWSDVPAFVDASGSIRIQRVEMSLLRALARRVPRGERVVQRRWVGPEFPGQAQDVEPALLLELVERGEWTLAQMVAQFRMGMSYDASVRFLLQVLSGD